MKNIVHKIIEDIKLIKLPIIILVLYYFVTHIFFGHSCPFLLFTGLPCAGCGLTRAFFCLLQLDLKGAIYYNCTIFLWLILMLLCFIDRYAYTMKRLVLAFTIFVCIATIVYYIYRMYLYFPNSPMDFYENNILHFAFNFTNKEGLL